MHDEDENLDLIDALWDMLEEAPADAGLGSLIGKWSRHCQSYASTQVCAERAAIASFLVSMKINGNIIDVVRAGVPR